MTLQVAFLRCEGVAERVHTQKHLFLYTAIIEVTRHHPGTPFILGDQDAEYPGSFRAITAGCRRQLS